MLPRLLFILLAAVARGGLMAAQPVTKPNVLFIAVDDLKPVLGCYGDKVIHSPNIDRLAARGVVFDRAYCNQAVCAPSRNSLMTGVRPSTLGIYDLGTNFRAASSNAVTLSQYFMRHGYRAEALGKIFHVGHGNHEDPASWSVPHFQAKSIAYVLPESRSNQSLTREEALFANITDVARLPRGAAYESADVPDDAYPDGRIADEAIRRLQAARAKPGEPFFLAVGFLKPHLPFCAPKKYWDLYDRASFTLPSRRTPPDGAPKYAPTTWGELRQYSDIPETGPLTDAQARIMIHGYHAAVSYVDAQLGRVLDELDRLGLASSTIIVLWGDHGWHLGDHGMWCKHSNYEQAARIPLIVCAPGVTRSGTRATHSLVETVDLYPTLAELAGLPAPDVPQPLEGRSFVPVLRDPGLGVKDHAFHVYPRGERIGRAVRTARYRLVEWKIPGAAADTADLELYDYEADPLETRNLAAGKPEVTSSLRAMLAGMPEAKPQIKAAKPRPNIVYILADDLGYGDVRCLNPQGKIATPHLDRLAAPGMIFTDAHSSSAVCTPTRYGLLTGRYNWRSRLKSGVMGGMSPPLIEPGRLTVPAFLQQQGYHTACIGKWHLGLDWPRKPDTAPFTDAVEKGAEGWRVDFSKPIARGPNSLGFDYFFGLAASLDMVPYSFIENDRITAVPAVDKAFPMMFGRTNGTTRKGPAAAEFEAIDVLPALTRRAIAHVNDRAGDAKAGRPFFLYLPLNAPHTPILPDREWQGKSGLNPYADFVMETDASVGAVLDALDRNGVAGNTLVIFASDNGCSPEAKFPELLARGHNPSAQFRGTKADIFDGGHRIPFLVRWPGRVKPGTRSDQLICLNDLFATCAKVLGVTLPDTAAEDSVSILPALEGRASGPIREALVHHSINGSFALRQGNWKLELCADSGGWSAPKPGSPAAKTLPSPQLYDLAADPGETKNLAGTHPELVKRMTKLLEKYVADGRSTPGAPQTNTTPVRIRARAATARTE